MKKSPLFDDFTRQYALSKTLRFELKPVGNTKEMLIENDVFVKDGIRKEKYEKAKIYFDRLHREFVRESLRDISLDDLDGYFVVFQKWQEDKKNKESFDVLKKKEKSLRQAIVRRFDNHSKEWAENRYSHLNLKKKSTDLLFEEEVFALLSDRYGAESDAHIVNPETGELVTLFDDWKGFTGYFKKFHETRKNFYKDDGTATAIATRAIDQNLRRFCDNIVAFERLSGKIDFAEIEENFGESMEDVFSMSFYDACIIQDGIDLYNRILGGETLENGEKKRGVNELVNKYRQDNKGEKLPFLKTLDKQILSERERLSFGIEDDQECFEVLTRFHENAVEKVGLLRNLLDELVSRSATFDIRKIYLSREAVNTIAHRWADSANLFEQLLFNAFTEVKDKSAKHKKEDDSYAFPDFISLDRIRSALEKRVDSASFWKSRYYKNKDVAKNKGVLSGNEAPWEQFLLIFEQEFGSLFRNGVINQETGDTYEVGYDVSLPIFERLLVSGNRTLNAEMKIAIKNFADDVLRIYQMGKYFSLEKRRAWNTEHELDSAFYSHPETGYMRFHESAYETIVQKYNDLRNYLTKKPYSEKKWKLNFENGSDFLGGWDQNQETKKYGTILRKGSKYYLGIFKKGHHNNIFRKDEPNSWSSKINAAYVADEQYYEKMEYKAIADSSKDISLLLSRASEENLRLFDPSERVLKIKELASYKKGDGFSLKDLHYLIDYYKSAIPLYRNWKFYNFNFTPTENYHDITEFTDEIARDGYKLWFEKVSQSYIEKKNQDGELYLFEIYNQDFASGRKTEKKNLHTMYWEGVFSPENMDGFPLKLNGEAEIFYRPATPKEMLGTRKDAKGKTVVSRKRYAEDKILFHCPITLNRGKGEVNPIVCNRRINERLAGNLDINIIGVDRGEKHLAYYSVISQQQDILESGSLNAIGGVDYSRKLEDKAENREQARRDWQSVEGIKDLKKGYVSQVVRRLVDLAIKHNAIIVLEDLNMRFKQIRGGIEKSIYQQLEKALIDKLCFLVEKGEIDPKKAGHLLNAYQLAAPFESFQKMGKQTGILFYTQASYTSKIDPLTGWRPNLYLKYGNAEKAREDVMNFSGIVFNESERRFEFSYDLKRFQDQKEWPENTEWTVCSCVERFRWNKTLNENKGGYDRYPDMTESFRKLFEDSGIDIRNDIKKQIGCLKTTGNEKFFRDFVFFWNLLCQIRNTDDTKKGDDAWDFILSPVAPFFDSRRTEDFGKNLPKNGDDNGAYNIARKGALILEKITDFKKKNGSCEKMSWGDLHISHSDWDTFAQRNRS